MTMVDVIAMADEALYWLNRIQGHLDAMFVELGTGAEE